MKLLKNSTYNELVCKSINLDNELSLLTKRHELAVEINQLQVFRISKLEKENTELSKKAEKWDAELKRQALKSKIARIKKMSAKQLATKFLGASIKFYNDVPAIICGHSGDVIICACDHGRQSWSDKAKNSMDVFLQKHERYVYYAISKVKSQIINSLK